MSNPSQEKRQIESFGPNCFLETGSNDQGAAGNTAMQLCSKNDAGHQMNISQHGSGLGRIHNDGTLEITSGQVEKAVQSKSGQGLMINNEHGKLDITSGSGNIGVTGPIVTIEARDTLILQAPNIRIGFSEKGKTKKIDLIGYKIECHDPKDGNIAVVLKTHNMFKAFAGSYVTDKIAGLYGL